MADERKLSAQQKRAIAALLESRDLRSAAKAAGIGERTLYRWMEDDAFAQELRRAESDLIDQATRRLLQGQQAAIAVTYSLMADTTVSPSVRLRAAGMVLDQMIRLRELRNVEDRLQALEETVANL